MTLFGILLGFVLLIWLAYRGWSIMVLVPPERRIIFGVVMLARR